MALTYKTVITNNAVKYALDRRTIRLTITAKTNHNSSPT